MNKPPLGNQWAQQNRTWFPQVSPRSVCRWSWCWRTLQRIQSAPGLRIQSAAYDFLAELYRVQTWHEMRCWITLGRISEPYYVIAEFLIQLSRILCYIRTTGGRQLRAWAGNKRSATGGVTPCFLVLLGRYPTYIYLHWKIPKYLCFDIAYHVRWPTGGCVPSGLWSSPCSGCGLWERGALRGYSGAPGPVCLASAYIGPYLAEVREHT